MFGPLLIDLARTHLRKLERIVVAGGAAAALAGYLILNPFFAVRDLVTADDGLSADTVAAMEWSRHNTPSEASFVVLSGRQTQEWLPHIARRTVLNMVFGSEWEPEERARILELDRLLSGCGHLDCVQASVAKTVGYKEAYLFLDRDRLSELMSASGGDESVFDLMYENGEIAIGRLSTP